MIKSASVLIFLISFLFLTINTSLARPLPADAKQHISKILEAPEFQPRKIQKGPVEKYFSTIANYLKNKIKQFFQGLKASRFEFSKDSWLSRFFAWIGAWWTNFVKPLGSFLSYSFTIALSALACFGIYYVYKHFSILQFLRVKTLETKASVSLEQVEEIPSVDELFSSKNFLATLTAIRVLLRKELLADYSVTDSLTDRELKRKAAKHPKIKTFKLASELFERVIYAGQSLSDQAVAELYKSYAEPKV